MCHPPKSYSPIPYWHPGRVGTPRSTVVPEASHAPPAAPDIAHLGKLLPSQVPRYAPQSSLVHFTDEHLYWWLVLRELGTLATDFTRTESS
ncbi:hypothetical protein PCASD_04166 [Puccinia coronata f. sp. avenae]|uniref:Uncharacterized protein n=1 Tax=Puccinia coronata f. sp. avenae TaxID=200324 RepID=A0A2N5SS73_9BASI|nr:hypothetical protein PCASD_20691 [Puccinia coronata f. sp. avenae]PLW46111.1 hypothetical protein PCASD_04166 [Puccinia coronata f. sp. avenae]